MTSNLSKLATIICFFFLVNLSAQNTLSGVLVDVQTNEPLIGGYIKCTNTVDSVVYFGASDYDGNFELAHIVNGNYFIEFTYIGYQNLQKELEINGSINIGNVGLQFSSTALKEIEVTAIKERVRQKGDTTLYNADAYGTNPDATTEDLLQKMPGFVVTDGKMQVQGENVTRILVNGEPFFGDDPDMALKNLPAEVIATIEVFDKSSQEEEEGSNGSGGDGAKTINIVLKEAYNNGEFGNIYSGYGYENKYKVGGNISYFKNNRRFNVLGQFNNINQQNFSSTDLLGISTRAGKGKNKKLGRNSNNFLVSKKGGINTTNAAGFNYQESWGKKLEILSSYFYNKSSNINQTDLTTTYFDTDLPSYEESSLENSNNLNHRLNTQLKYKINDRNTFFVKPALIVQQHTGRAESTTNIFNQNRLTSSLADVLLTDFSAIDFSNRMNFSHKFTNKKRSISISFKNRIKMSNGYQNATSHSINATVNDSLILNQEANLENRKETYGASIRYLEPIGEKSKLMIEYAFDTEQNEADIRTYTFEETSGAHTFLEEDLSNEFNNDYQAHKGTIGYKYKKRKIKIDIKGSFQEASLVNHQVFPLETETKKSFKNFLPSINYSYRINKSENLRFSYRTRINLPKATDLQAVIDNSNPLRVVVGNPNLSQQVSNSFDIKYSANNSEKGTVLFAYFKSTFLTDYIGKSIIIATEADTIEGIVLRKGAQFRTPINLSGYRLNYLFMTYGFPMLSIKSNLNFNISLSHKKIPVSINEASLFTNTKNITSGIVLSSNISKAIDFTIQTTTNLSFAQNTNLNKRKIFDQQTSAKLNYIFANKWQVNTNVTHRYFNAFNNNPIDDFVVWNASLGYKFLANNNGELRLTLFDILKSNVAIKQNYGEVFLTQTETAVLTQFFMFSFRYNIRN